MRKTSDHFGSTCAAIETQIVSTSLLDRVQDSSYGTDAVSVGGTKIETEKCIRTIFPEPGSD